MASFKGLAWNCSGLRARSPRSHEKVLFFEKNQKNNFDIAFFIETHHKNEDEIPSEIFRYQQTHHIVHTPATKSETFSGIVGLVNKEYEIKEEKELVQGRVLNIKIQRITDKTDYNISAVYLDTNNNITKAKLEKIIATLRLEYQDHSNNMILGDFNFIDHEKDKANGLNSADKLACKLWKPFIEEMDMLDPYREQNPKRKIWSFIGTGNAGNSRIDRLYVNSVNMKNIINFQYIHSFCGT